MDLGIIGYGTVGKAVHNSVYDRFNKVKVYDPDKGYINFEHLINTYAIFICVPTPTRGGYCNDIFIENTLDKLKEHNYSGLCIFKSTLLPKRVRDFLESYPDLKIIVAPEFLDQNNPYKEQQHIIGVDSLFHAEMYKDIFCNVKITTPETAMMMKYIHNIYGATKVIFFNLMKDICDLEDVDYREMLRCLFTSTDHIGKCYTNIASDGERGFGGACFPKDIIAFNKEYPNILLRAVIELNKQYRKNEMEVLENE